MKPQHTFHSLFIVLILLFGPMLKAQTPVGLGIGYSIGHIGAPILNETIDRYNVTRTWLDKEMHSIHGLNGLDLNLRVGRSWQGVLGLRANSRRVHAEGTPSGGDPGWRKFKTSHTELMLGLETPQVAILRLGTGLYLASTRFKTRSNLDEKMYAISSKGGLGLRLYLRLYLPLSGQIGLNFMPFYQTDFYKANLYEVEKTLDPANWSKFDEANFNERLNMFGLSVCLYFGGLDRGPAY